MTVQELFTIVTTPLLPSLSLLVFACLAQKQISLSCLKSPISAALLLDQHTAPLSLAR